MRGGRRLGQGDLRLIALTLIAEQPRHGYELIKLFEEKTSGWYSPSPGVIYPSLTYLEEAGHVTSQTDGSKKLYNITADGLAYLGDNRDLADAVLNRFTALSERAARWRNRADDDDDRDGAGTHLPRLIEAALDNLREVAVKCVHGDADAEVKVVDVLARAAAELRRSST